MSLWGVNLVFDRNFAKKYCIVPEGGEDPVRGGSQILCGTPVSYLKNVFKDAMPEGGDTGGGGAGRGNRMVVGRQGCP